MKPSAGMTDPFSRCKHRCEDKGYIVGQVCRGLDAGCGLATRFFYKQRLAYTAQYVSVAGTANVASIPVLAGGKKRYARTKTSDRFGEN